MKGLIKLFSAVAFVGALASCSDDLSISKANLDPNADLYATLPESETTRMGVLANKDVVWSEGDVINVYSANSLKFDRYELTSGAGESTASFVQLSPNNGVASLGNLVAVSSSQYLKGVHADENGKMNLIAIIPANFTQNELIGEDQKTVYWPLAIPYWDNNISFSGDKLNANMKALTALLKINIKDLPEGTKAIVLNTHHFAYLSDAEKALGVNELGGSDEALSGTLTTILEGEASLKVDEDYRHADTLRVDIDELDKDQDKIIFVPIIAGHYDKLTVLAVSEDSKQAYVWPNAEVLRVFEDQDFETKGKYGIAQTATLLYDTAVEGTDPLDLSKWIAEQILNDGTHTIKVQVDGGLDAGTLYLMNNDADPDFKDKKVKQTSVDIEFLDPIGNDLDIVEAFANYNPSMSGWRTLSTSAPWLDAPAAPYEGLKSLDKKRTATITFANGEANDHNIILPSSNVVLKESGIATGAMYILGSNTRQVSGYTDDWSFDEPRNYRNAGIVIRGSWGTIAIHQNQFGHVYANGDGVDDEIQLITFLGSMNRTNPTATQTEWDGVQKGNDSSIDFRVTDMLIAEINYLSLGSNAESNIYTTGNSALKAITETSSHRINKVNLSASWTSQKLSDYALDNGYDQSEIFTAAQLSSMGLASKEGALVASPYIYFMSDRTRSVWLGGKKFPWIGADVTSPTNGTITEDFEFDGKNCNFRNMYFDLYEPYLPIDCCCEGPNRIAVDEGLGLIRRIDTEGTVDIKNVDLTDALMDAHRFNISNIGSICGRITAQDDITLTNNRADDIRIDANGSNIGGAFGWINQRASGVTTIENLAVKENSSIFGKSWVTSKGMNVGGAIGLISGAETAINNYVSPAEREYNRNWYRSKQLIASGIDVYEEFVISESDNVGGQVGGIYTQELDYYDQANVTSITSNVAHINDKVRTIGQNVGGLIGFASVVDKIHHVQGTVEVGKEIYAQYNPKRTLTDNSNMTGSNVGGLVGGFVYQNAVAINNNTTTIEGTVRVDENIIAENRNAGGFIGFYEANHLEIGANDNNELSVTVENRLEAIEGYVGGLIGILNTADQVQIGRDDAKGSITVTVNGAIAGTMAVGGLIGASNNGSATADNNLQLQVLTSKDKKYNIKVDINDWINTVAALNWSVVPNTIVPFGNERVLKTTFTRPSYVSPCVTTDDYQSNLYPGWYAGTGQGKYAGSFGTVIGWLNNVIKIVDSNLSVVAKSNILKQFKREATNYWGAPTFTSTNPIFTDLKKVTLLFVVQSVSQATQIEQAITGQGIYYWGDENGYVGVNNNSSAGGGSYILNGNKLKGDTNYNLYYDYRTAIDSNADLWPKTND